MSGAEACDAEILGALKALEAAIAIDKDSQIKIIDCQNTASALRGILAKSSLGLVDKFEKEECSVGRSKSNGFQAIRRYVETKWQTG